MKKWFNKEGRKQSVGRQTAVCPPTDSCQTGAGQLSDWSPTVVRLRSDSCRTEKHHFYALFSLSRLTVSHCHPRTELCLFERYKSYTCIIIKQISQ